MAPTPPQLGARLGVRIAQIAAQAREVSVSRTTPGVTQQVIRVAEQVAEVRADQARVALEGWLEDHASSSPLPGPVGGLLGALGKLGGFLAQNVFGTAIGFGVGGALTGVLEPYFAELQQAAWRSHPIQVLSPAELALAVLRGNLDRGPAETEAQLSGVDSERFRTMVDNTGEPPAPGDLLGLWKRGKVSEADVERAVRQSRIRPEWVDTVKKLAIQPPTWTDALEARLEGQLSEAEARTMYDRLGGDPDWYEVLFNTRGQAPTPVQALDLLNRGIIGETGRGPDQVTYEQAFLEGPWRNKWKDAFLALREYLPPPRSVPTLLRNGAITEQVALDLFQRNGLTPDMARAYVDSALAEQTAGTKDLTTSQVLDLYRDRFVPEGQAVAMLTGLGYAEKNARWLLASADLAREKRFLESFITRVRSLYVGHRITDREAQELLNSQEVPGEQKAYLLDLWDAERGANVPVLSVAQLQAALKQGILAEDAVRAELASRGYPRGDVAVLIALAEPPEAPVATPKRLTAAQVLAALAKELIQRPEALADLELLGYSEVQANLLIDTRLTGR